MSMFDGVAAELAQPGTVAVLPTDTVYGLVARASDEVAVRRLYELKHREHKPGTMIAGSLEQLESLGLKHRYLTAVAQYWPAALSVVIPCTNPQLEYLHQGLQSLAVRLPDNPQIQELLRQTGPLLTSSANQPGKPPANTLAEARAYFGDLVPLYVDGGDLSGRAPSTVIRIIDDAVEVLRVGAVQIDPKLLQ